MSLLWTSQAKVGCHRGRHRIYMQGVRLRHAGFAVGAPFVVEMAVGRIVVRAKPQAPRRVSRKRQGQRTVPVLDLNARGLLDSLGGAEQVEIIAYVGRLEIAPVRTIRMVISRVRSLLEGSLFSGAGFMTEAARRAGYRPAWGVEVDARCAETYSRNHPRSLLFNQCVREVDVTLLRQVDVLTAGIPCEPFSQARVRSGQPLVHDLLDMVFWVLRVVDAVNPRSVVLENVPRFLESDAGALCQTALRFMGYVVQSRVVDSCGHGTPQRRMRSVVVATTGGGEFSWPEPEAPAPFSEIMDDGPHDWWDRQTKPWVFEHWDKQRSQGTNFISAVVTPDSRAVPTLTKRYYAAQGTSCVVAHPERADTYRWLTISEGRRLMGVPQEYWLPEAKTVAGEQLGQGVVVPLFEKMFRSLRGVR